MNQAVADHQRFRGVGRWLVTGLLVAAGLGVAALVYHYAPLLSPAAQVRVPLDPACDLKKAACTSQIPGGGKVTLSITPRPIPVMEKIQIAVQTEDLKARAVEVDFAGVDMNMGFNRYKLTAAGGGRFGGIGVLPVCIRDRMAWEATVMIHTLDGLIAAPFRFDTLRRH